jgi:hypothetical protein
VVVCYGTERFVQGVPASNVVTHSATVENTPNVTTTNQCGGGYVIF